MTVDLVGVLTTVFSSQCSPSLVFLEVVHTTVCLTPDVRVRHNLGRSGHTKGEGEGSWPIIWCSDAVIEENYGHWMELNSLSLLFANTNGGKQGMFGLDRGIANATNISSNQATRSPTWFYITGAMVIVISLSCHISYICSGTHSNSVNGRINTQHSQW